MPLQAQRRAIKGFGENDIGLRLRSVFLELRPPGLQLLLHVRTDGRNGVGGREHLGLGKGRLDGAQAEVVIRIALADVDGRQVLARGLDRIRYGAAIG